MQQSEITVRDAVPKSRRKMYDLADDKLGVTLGALTVYIPINKVSILPHFTIESMFLWLPLYSKKFIGIQDLVMEYVYEILNVCSKYKSRKSAPTHHHHSSSSMNIVMGSGAVMGMNPTHSGDRMQNSTRQSLLQKGASKVKQMANSVKKNVTSTNQKKDVKKREVQFSISMNQFSIHVQPVEEFFFTYSIQSFIGKYSSKLTVVSILEHEGHISRPSSSHSEPYVPLPKLPEITLVFSTPQAEEITRTHNPSISTVSSMNRFRGDTLISQKTLMVSPSVYNSNSGIAAEKEESISLSLEIGVLKVELSTKQVSVVTSIIVIMLLLVECLDECFGSNNSGKEYTAL